MTPRTLTLLFLVASLSIVLCELGCLDKDGKKVPWFNALKYPATLTKVIQRYSYLDPTIGSAYKMIAGRLIDHPTEPLTKTIAKINSLAVAQKNLIVFNDGVPPEVPRASSDAHAKGIIAFDDVSKTGVYIMHSIPNFPSVNQASGVLSTSVPSSGLQYAQHIYCISLNKNNFDQIFYNLPIQKPIVYYASGVFKNLPARGDLSSVREFTLTNGEKQWFLTKAPKFNGFLYENIVQPYFKTSLAVESWGRPYQNPSCPPHYTYHSLNIASLKFSQGDTWVRTQDHSKWAVSIQNGVKVACFCDMNRMESQSKRGGSCLCTKNPNIHNALSQLIATTDSCPNKNFRGAAVATFNLLGTQWGV